MAAVFYSVIAIGLIVSALVSRRRILACSIIHDAPHAPAAPYRFITAEGAAIEGPLKQAAGHCAGICDLDVLDLVPADLPAEKLLALMQLYNPGRYRANRIAGAVSAGHALLIAEAVANRAGIGEDKVVAEDAFFALARRLKKCAPCRAGIAIAPDFTSAQQARMPPWRHCLRCTRSRLSQPSPHRSGPEIFFPQRCCAPSY
jgi:hypothetical protein